MYSSESGRKPGAAVSYCQKLPATEMQINKNRCEENKLDLE